MSHCRLVLKRSWAHLSFSSFAGKTIRSPVTLLHASACACVDGSLAQDEPPAACHCREAVCGLAVLGRDWVELVLGVAVARAATCASQALCTCEGQQGRERGNAHARFSRGHSCPLS